MGKLWLVTSFSAMDAAAVVAIVQAIAWLLLPLPYAVVSLSWRGEATWFPRPAGLYLLGILTAVLEACAHVIG
jgi:hypothetical protein